MVDTILNIDYTNDSHWIVTIVFISTNVFTTSSKHRIVTNIHIVLLGGSSHES